MTPLGQTSILKTAKSLPVAGDILAGAVVGPIEGTLDPLISTVLQTTKPILEKVPGGDAINQLVGSTTLDQAAPKVANPKRRDGVAGTVEGLPIVGGIVAGALKILPLVNVGDVLGH